MTFLAWSPDDKWLVTCNSDKARITDLLALARPLPAGLALLRLLPSIAPALHSDRHPSRAAGSPPADGTAVAHRGRIARAHARGALRRSHGARLLSPSPQLALTSRRRMEPCATATNSRQDRTSLCTTLVR